MALPAYFRSEIEISGVLVTDIFALNSSLGSTIEEKAVESLNQVRSLWDPETRYAHYSFVRQTQTFPDVLLRKRNPEGKYEILLGIELKGWYLLAKEGEPSLRFVASRDACAAADLVVVFPWVLANVISGSPKLFTPFIAPARHVAEYRNHHWKHSPKVRNPIREITLASGVAPYPKKSDLISDHAVADDGGNFGRIARTGLMDEYKAELDQELLCGVPARHWRTFFKIFSEGRTADQIESDIERLVRSLAAKSKALSSGQIEDIQGHLRRIADLLASTRI